MSQTRAQRKKQAKKRGRERNAKKRINLSRSQKDNYRLDVLVDGRWIPGVMRFGNISKVDEYIAVTEVRRKEGEEIAPGRVFDMETGIAVRDIQGSKRKGALPDTISDGPKADPDVKGEAEEKPKETLTKRIIKRIFPD